MNQSQLNDITSAASDITKHIQAYAAKIEKRTRAKMRYGVDAPSPLFCDDPNALMKLNRHIVDALAKLLKGAK